MRVENATDRRAVMAASGTVCLLLGAVAGAALVFGLGTLRAPAILVIAVTTVGFLAAGAVLIVRAYRSGVAGATDEGPGVATPLEESAPEEGADV